jgi:hypothetical protein
VLGEHVAFTASQLDVDGRRISVDRLIVETRSAMARAISSGPATCRTTTAQGLELLSTGIPRRCRHLR